MQHVESNYGLSFSRLSFQLPDFTRISWVSDKAKSVWQPRITRIGKAWLEIEWRAVQFGLRACAVQLLTPECLVKSSKTWAREGLCVVPLAIQGQGDTYSSTATPVNPDHPIALRCVIGSPRNASDFSDALNENNNDVMGDLLGYPRCCQEFFRKVWVEDAMVDTTWPMALSNNVFDTDSREIDVAPISMSNILWRWVGVRCVSHLPCSFSCKNTISVASRLIDLGRTLEYQDEMDWLLDILAWPVEWSALHGIAEIKTPILKVSTRTDATAHKYIVRYNGKIVPSECASGLAFPYSTSSLPILTKSSTYVAGLDNPIITRFEEQLWYFKDNQFDSLEAMNTAHEPIVATTERILQGRSGHVLDLGCGNGVLLKKITSSCPCTIPHGIDISSECISHAKGIMNEFATNFHVGDLLELDAIRDENRVYELGIFMPGRLLECDPLKRQLFLDWLTSQCKNIVVYAYGDWLQRYGGLEALANAVGLQLQCRDPQLSSLSEIYVDNNVSMRNGSVFSEAGIVLAPGCVNNSNNTPDSVFASIGSK